MEQKFNRKKLSLLGGLGLCGLVLAGNPHIEIEKNMVLRNPMTHEATGNARPQSVYFTNDDGVLTERVEHRAVYEPMTSSSGIYDLQKSFVFFGIPFEIDTTRYGYNMARSEDGSGIDIEGKPLNFLGKSAGIDVEGPNVWYLTACDERTTPDNRLEGMENSMCLERRYVRGTE